MSPRARRPGGFGLLEAIVALAIFAGAGMAIFAWINSTIAIAARLRESEDRTRLLSMGSGSVQVLDLAAMPSGETDLAPGIRLRWQSRPLVGRTPVAPLPGGISTSYEAALVRVDAVITEASTGTELPFSQNRLAILRNDPETAEPDSLSGEPLP